MITRNCNINHARTFLTTQLIAIDYTMHSQITSDHDDHFTVGDGRAVFALTHLVLFQHNTTSTTKDHQILRSPSVCQCMSDDDMM